MAIAGAGIGGLTLGRALAHAVKEAGLPADFAAISTSAYRLLPCP